MKKTNHDKKVSLHPLMNRKDIYLDSQKADAAKKNMIKQLDVIANSFSEIHTILNRFNMKKYLSEGSSGVVVQTAKKCLSQSQAARTLSINLEAKYCEDQKNIIIEDLNTRIAFLEERLSQKK